MIKFFFLFFLLALTSCYRVSDQIEPKVSQLVEKKHFEELDSAFFPLSEEERAEDWGKEYIIAKKFGEYFDLYRSISTFKRAEVLIDTEKERSLEISYYIVLSYYLGKKYIDAIEAFENSNLAHVDLSFSTFHDLLIILYDCYLQIEDEKKAQKVAEVIENTYPTTHQDLVLSTALLQANLEKLQLFSQDTTANNNPSSILENYDKEKKSVATAQSLNALVPGMGYYYLGQKKSAVTAFLLNGLFTSAAYYFFHKGNIAAGLITTSFEMGWYFGGIYGAGESAKYHNERIYEKYTAPHMKNHKLFPVFQLQYGF